MLGLTLLTGFLAARVLTPAPDHRPANNRSRPFLPDRPIRPVGARPPLNWSVSPKSPEGRTSYEGATGIKPNETKRNETESVIERRARPHSLF